MNILHLQPPRTNHLHFFPKKPFHVIEFRVFKRRKLKHNKNKLIIRNQLSNNTFDNLFPSINSLDLIAPALGFVSGLSLLRLSRPKPISNNIGKWILFTSPTPFNRFVTLRCPSISLEESENMNEKLIKEDTHSVRVNSGKFVMNNRNSGSEFDLLEYQRICVTTEDGGVISLDWPANLELEKEHGLDTTILIVPGTAEGSNNSSIKSFVIDCFKRGYFPVVMNPRGCASSPLTTARLFTAADSDDVCTAIQFINGKRQWTTLMGVGWGYGANMLTKYLAEVGEKTPLTAATCIDNPFDLEEATKYSTYLDQKLTGGLRDILLSNKELFQGKTKGFDVEKGLVSKSVRDFDAAISMVSYGFDEIKDFYSKSSTRGVVANIQIPVLFIQNEDGALPVFTIPRSLIAENSFTSLLLCSFLPSNVIASGRSVMSWCQNLTIEWLAAVELGFLKGRHPILKDVDVNINSSKGLTLVDSRASDQGSKISEIPTFSQKNALNGKFVDSIKKMLEDGDTNMLVGNMPKTLEFGNKGLQQVGSSISQEGSIDAELVKQDEDSAEDSERGQVLQTAEVVMNMLDLTMPSTLTEEEKKKVLTAVGQGESLMKALQDAVPDDVRGKLTTAVSGILRSQGINLKLDSFLHSSRIPNVSSTSNSHTEENIGGLSSAESLITDSHPPDQRSKAVKPNDGADNDQQDLNEVAGQLESELQPSEKAQKSIHSPDSNHGGLDSSVSRNDDNSVYDDSSSDNTSEYADYNANDSAYNNSRSLPDRSGGTEEATIDLSKANQESGMTQLDAKDPSKIEEKDMDSSSNQNNMTSPSETEDILSPSESQLEGHDNQKKEDKGTQPVLDRISNNSDSTSLTFSVSQALDALTGMDDSTQVAVNSVFGVIEDMISHLEEGKDNGDEENDKIEINDEKTRHGPESHVMENKSIDSNMVHDTPAYDVPVNYTELHDEANTEEMEERLSENTAPFIEKDVKSSQGFSISSLAGMIKNGSKEQMVGSELLVEDSDTHKCSNIIPPYVSTNSYSYSLHSKNFQRYLLSKIPDSKSLDIDSTTALLLDYFPEDGQWKLLEQSGSIGESSSDAEAYEGVDYHYSPRKSNVKDEIIEPAYVILDTEKQQETVGKYEMVDKVDQHAEIKDDKLDKLMHFVKNIVMDSLRVEVSRKLSAGDMQKIETNLTRDLEQVANAVSRAVHNDNVHILSLEGRNIDLVHDSRKVATLHGEHIISATTFAVQETMHLRKILPVGVIVGSNLAALRKFFDVTIGQENAQSETMILDQVETTGQTNQDQVGEKKHHKNSEEPGHSSSSECLASKDSGEGVLKNLNNDSVMVGAVTTALGASALFIHQQGSYEGDETTTNLSKFSNDRRINQKGPQKLEEEVSEDNQNNIVTSLAEKAMSVAGPVVPTKEDGEVDQERLVAMLADLGQKGGMLRLVGKVALLWGGIRGAMSLTDKLISFLRISERPLIQRVIGFVCMVLVLWSPVVLPLLPTLVQSWATHNSSGFADLSCIIGLYIAVILLVTLWGKRIRGYDNSLEQYGLDLTLLKVQDFLKAFIGGVVIVLSIQFVNTLLGFAILSWQTALPSSSLDYVTWLKVYGKMLMLAGQGIVTGTAMAVVEELLFRSWLPEEISSEFGYHYGIIISGLAFSLTQRSAQAIPGLWLLSLALAGVRQKNQGSLFIPIGLRSGITAASFVIQGGGLLTYQSRFSLWVTGTHPFQPFSGVVGLAFSFLLAVLLYPRQPLHHKKNIKRTIRE